MRSFALTALTFLTLGVFSYAAPIVKVDDGSLVKVDADAGVTVRDNSSKDDKCLEDVINGVVHDVEKVLDEISKSSVDKSTTFFY
jgi:hypothetical protein